MYIPIAFAEADQGLIKQLIKDNPLATLINHNSDGLTANHIPFLWVDQGEYGRLAGHLAKANPLGDELHQKSEVLAVFQCANSY